MNGASLAEIGGPQVFTSAQATFHVPVNTAVFYDFDIVVRNSDGADDIDGGLNGEPSRFNLYGRAPGEPEALYHYSVAIYGSVQYLTPSGNGWHKASSARTIHHKTSSITDLYLIDWRYRDAGRKAPGPYQIAIPPAYACLSANDRVFVGSVKDLASQHQYGDLYGSEWQQPFRFQAIVTSSVSGGRAQFHGERIQAFLSLAAENQGASKVLVLTNEWRYSLGRPGPFSGSPVDSFELFAPVREARKGTNAPRSVVEGNGAGYYLDQYGEYERFLGTTVPISKQVFDDKYKAAVLPAARRDDVGAAFIGDVLYSPYTDGLGQTTNRRIIGWNEWLGGGTGACEFDDAPPVAAERIGVYYDPSLAGSGQLLLIASAAGAVYKYEVAGSDDLGSGIAVRLTTGELPSREPGQPLIVDSVTLEADEQAATLTVDRIYRSPDCTYTTTLSLNQDEGLVTDEAKDHTEASAPADAQGERGAAVQLDIYGTVATATRFRTIDADVKVLSNYEARPG